MITTANPKCFSFNKYLRKHLLPAIPNDENFQKPVLVLDMHRTHYALIYRKLLEKRFTLMYTPP